MDDNIEEKLEALEQEKEEYLDEHPDEDEEYEEEEVEEDVDVDETEFSLTEDDIDEWIARLTELKEEKKSIELEIDEETTLKINFEESEDE